MSLQIVQKIPKMAAILEFWQPFWNSASLFFFGFCFVLPKKCYFKVMFTLWLLTRDPSQSGLDPGRGLINFAFTLHALLSWKIDPHR